MNFASGCKNQHQILQECSTRKNTNREANDKCSFKLSGNCSPMRLQWNLLGVLHSGPSTWKAASWLGFKWLGGEGGGVAFDSTPLDSHIVGPSRDLLYTSISILDNGHNGLFLLKGSLHICLIPTVPLVAWVGWQLLPDVRLRSFHCAYTCLLNMAQAQLLYRLDDFLI